MRYILLFLLLFALPCYAVDTVQIDRDNVTTPVVIRSAAFKDYSSFATKAQGAKADSALQPDATSYSMGTLKIHPSSGIGLGVNAATDPGAGILEISNVNGAQYYLTNYGGSFSPQAVFRAANGTAASPTATGIGQTLMALFGLGYTGTGGIDGAWAAASSVGIVGKSTETFTTTARGAYLAFQTTAPTTISRTEKMRIHGSGGVSIGNTTDPGAGNLILNGKLQTQNVEEKSAVLTAASNVFTPDLSQGSTFVVTLAATNTIANPTNIPANGRVTTFTMLLKQDATGNRTVGTWGTAYNFGDAGTPVLTTTANKKDIMTCLVAEGAISGCFLSGTGF